MLQRPSIKNFVNNLKNAWEKDMVAPISWEFRCQKPEENIFLIRHFTNDVTYSTVSQSIDINNDWFSTLFLKLLTIHSVPRDS